VRNMAYKTLGRKRSLAANEDLFREDGVAFIGGTDEAGRGALAGPLVAAAVVFDPGVEVEGVNDSKLLSPERREELYLEIIKAARNIAVISIDASLIDRWGLQMVNLKALADALTSISADCDLGICDHFTLTGFSFPTYGIPHADEIFHSVAAASIVAKVERDRVMRSLHRLLPRYHFEDNKGYGTEEHLEALCESGPCEVHRLSFSSVSPDAVEIPLWEPEDGA
jgi:ribonuclease HII